MIVEAANSIIINNKDQIFKKIWTHNEEGNRIKLMRAKTDNEEGNIVASSIFEIRMSNQLPNKDFAILYRTNAQSRSCLLYTSPSPRDRTRSRMPSSA